LTERCDKVQQIKWYLNLQVEFIREYSWRGNG
jgi:hypothetical protein